VRQIRADPTAGPDAPKVQYIGSMENQMKGQVMDARNQNFDEETVRSFGREWSTYDQSTNAYDRLSTPLEQRFSRAWIETMMRPAGLDHIVFSERAPFWCAVGRRVLVR
jgi:hypothetical protein